MNAVTDESICENIENQDSSNNYWNADYGNWDTGKIDRYIDYFPC